MSGEPDTEDHHSDLLEQDISIDSPHRSRSNLGVGQVEYIIWIVLIGLGVI